MTEESIRARNWWVVIVALRRPRLWQPVAAFYLPRCEALDQMASRAIAGPPLTAGRALHHCRLPVSCEHSRASVEQDTLRGRYVPCISTRTPTTNESTTESALDHKHGPLFVSRNHYSARCSIGDSGRDATHPPMESAGAA